MNDMNIFIKIELLEIVVALGYYIFSKGKERHATRVSLLSIALALVIDVFLLHGKKPDWAWIMLNTPFLWYLYEKLLRKFTISLYRNLAATLDAMLD